MSDFDPIVTVRRADLRTVLIATANTPHYPPTEGAFYRLLEAVDGMQCWEPAVVPADDGRRLVDLARKRLTLSCPDEMAVERVADCLGMNDEEAPGA